MRSFAYIWIIKEDIMKKSILKSSIALAVAGVFGATVAVTAAEQATPVPVVQEVAVTATPVAQPAADQAVPKIEVYRRQA